MFKKPNNSGWILCPSKSYPGKFYYFNVLNGEAAWGLNENEKKVIKREITIQKVKANHLYPEPITPPDHPSPRAYNDHSTIRTCLPIFGQAVFPNYISNNKENLSNICTPIQKLQKVTNTKIMFNQSTQTEQDNINVPTYTIPLSKRFENNTNGNLVSINYVAATQPKEWWNTTNIWSNIGKHSDTADMYRQKLVTKSLLKESKLKKLKYTNKKYVYQKHAEQNSIQLHCNKVENSKKTNKMLINMDVHDLRHLLRAKRRKNVNIQNLYNNVNKEHSTLNDTNKETFNVRHNKAYHSEEDNIGKETTYIDNKNQQSSEWYLVVDLDVLLEDYGFINRYIDEDENCHLYVPSVILNKLKNICMGEHGGRSRVIVARQLLRKLENIMPKLNLLENKEDTKMNQIINCCLEIMKGNNDVVLITKEIELIQTAKLYKIKAFHINDLKSNDTENNFIDTYKYKNNLFFQNTDDFDPFGLSKTVRDTENSPNILGSIQSFNNDLVLNLSDINMNFSKLNINDKILNIKRKVENNLFGNKIIKSNDNVNCNFKTFHNISINKTVQRYSNDVNNKRLFNKKQNITFNTKKEHSDENLEHTNVNVIRKPLIEVFDDNTTPNNIFEDMLKKFYITNSVMEHNLYLRFDEWVCSYEQIIEDFLYIILQNNPQVTQPSPWFLHEGMECLKDIYSDNEYIINIIEKLLYYYDYSSESGTNVKPYNFMKLFGCGYYLVEALEKTAPLLISDIKKKLIYLRDVLECPIEDLFLDSPICNNTEDEQTNRCNFVKNSSDVLDYLKNNFSEWKNYNGAYDNILQIEQEVDKDNTKVLRTFGRHLNKLTINKLKCMSYIKETDKQTHKHLQSNDYPKVIRNIKLLDKYEEKIKTNKNGLDCPEIAETTSSTSFYRDDNKAIINDVAETNDFGILSQNNDSQNINLSINDYESTKDSGIGSNRLHAYSLVRNFLTELSSSFKIIHTFIDESIKDYSDDIAEENKKSLYEKAIKTHTHVADIIDKLKIIIQRESIENSTLKSLLIKAGTDDKRTTRYRPVVMKCLEQARILEKSLKLMLSITNEDVLSVSTEENLHFINIYE